MAKIKLKFKTPSKSKIKRDMRKAIRKNLVCPNCDHKLPYTSLSSTKCSRCGTNITINI